MSIIFIGILLGLIVAAVVFWKLDNENIVNTGGRSGALGITFTLVVVLFGIFGSVMPMWNKTVEYDTHTVVDKSTIGFVANPNGAYHVVLNNDYAFVSAYDVDDVCIEVTTKTGGLFPVKGRTFKIVKTPTETLGDNQ